MKPIISILLSILLFTNCSDNSISTKEYAAEVERDLEAKLTLLDGKFSIDDAISGCANNQEIEAMKFLYAYMPIGDMIDYDKSLYLNGVRSAFVARKEMAWGKSVPKQLFRHFVLPIRVNNENLDNSREIFYNELKDRVAGLSMYDAILEVNHWCHEKVIYTPSDGRTSSPLASVKTAYGRCGEESVFAVAALRSVGIPARQVYTPRWAHTDDNHAWVEAWADGKWYYLGACEPEAKLDVAWFSSTVTRGLLMHTKVFGKYNGDEDIISVTDCYTEINVTSNYAPTKRLVVLLNGDNGGVEGAKVEFKIFNYGEFYSAITTATDSCGMASATLGKGDILVWISKGDRFAFSRVAADQDTLKFEYNSLSDNIKMSKAGDVSVEKFTPPAEKRSDVVLTEEEVEANNMRLAKEDSIRLSYTATFATIEDARKLKLRIDSELIFKYLQASRGNWREIESYLTGIDSNSFAAGIKLLDLISEKDLRDTPSATLLDHLSNYNIDQSDAIYLSYVLNPRVSLELLTPWRSFFQELIDKGTFNNNPNPDANTIIEFVKKVKVLDNYNPQGIPMTPMGVYNLMAADSKSRNVLFVALCRSANIPARIEEVGGKLQYFGDGKWNDVSLDGDEKNSVSIAPKGDLHLQFAGHPFIKDPKYETHFTIAKIENGTIRSLNFTDKEGREGSITYNGIFSKPIHLDCGNYMLTSGVRLASGTVLVSKNFFTIQENKKTDVPLVFGVDKTELQVIGSMNPEWKFSQLLEAGKSKSSSILECTGRGFFVIAFLKSNHEPSNHVIRDLFKNEATLPIIILYRNQGEYKKYLQGEFPTPSKGIYFGIDENDEIFTNITKEMKMDKIEYPLVVIADSFGRIVYISEGYQIGIDREIERLSPKNGIVDK